MTSKRLTIFREAEQAMFATGLDGRETEFLDSLFMEAGMRHFYTRAMAAKDKNLEKAVAIAEKIAPYRHVRLSAVKLADNSNNPLRVWDNATADELRAEIMRHLSILTEKEVLDFEALRPSKRRIAN
jgi:protein-disulfide isomerase-like protein with CxxC motif